MTLTTRPLNRTPSSAARNLNVSPERLVEPTRRWLAAEAATTPSAATRHALAAIHDLLDIVLDVVAQQDDELFELTERVRRLEAGR